MSEINPATTPGTATTGSTSAVSASTISDDFDTFLQLLTAQIRNQDPLAPLDSTQFVEQLATFSSLEQQVETNQTLGNIASMIGDLHSALATEWLGQDVAVSAKHIAYEGEPVEFEVNPAYDYDEAVLTVTDTNNQIVWQEKLDADDQRFAWNGETLDTASPANKGIYQMQIDLFANGQALATTQAEIVSKVTNLANENGQLKLGTNNYLTTDLNNVRKLSVD
ncbi:MAG: flagellar hook capping FlgD N-terminal domain-containing protein [Pseudomonadota bacterium]